MQYKVPQFIEVEDKIFGPLTFRQFLYLAAGGGATLLFITLLPLWAAIPVSIPFIAAGASLAFYRVNDRPLLDTLENAFTYFSGSKLYLWQHRDRQAPRTAKKDASVPMQSVPKYSESKLRDLAWSLNIKDRLAEGERETEQ